MKIIRVWIDLFILLDSSSGMMAFSAGAVTQLRSFHQRALLSDKFHGFIPVPSPRYRRLAVYNFYYLRYRDGERARLRRENCTLLPEGTFQMSCLRRG